MTVIATALQTARHAIAALEQAQPLAQLAARLYVAQAFFASGLTKIRDWETTLALFADEYPVPLLLAVGLAGRFVAPRLAAFGPYTRAA